MSFTLQFTLPQSDGKHQDHQTLGSLVGHSDTLAIAQASEQFNGLSVVITPDTRSALRLEKSLPQFCDTPIQIFPDWETLPYDNFSPHQDIISARLSALFQLQQGRKLFKKRLELMFISKILYHELVNWCQKIN